MLCFYAGAESLQDGVDEPEGVLPVTHHVVFKFEVRMVGVALQGGYVVAKLQDAGGYGAVIGSGGVAARVDALPAFFAGG